MSGPRKPRDGLLGIAFRFFLFLLAIKFIYLDWFRLLVGPGGQGGHEEEIAGALDNVTRGPEFPTPGSPRASIRSVGPRTPPPIPSARTTGSDPRDTAASDGTPAPAPPPVDRNGRTTPAP